MDFLKTVGGKIATGVVVLAVGAAGLAWYETDPATKHAILSDTGKIIGWILLVAILPWASFALVSWVAKFDTNAAGASLVFGLSAVEALLLAWMFGWSIPGAAMKIVFAAAVLIAGVYNLFACDWIAERVS